MASSSLTESCWWNELCTLYLCTLVVVFTKDFMYSRFYLDTSQSNPASLCPHFYFTFFYPQAQYSCSFYTLVCTPNAWNVPFLLVQVQSTFIPKNTFILAYSDHSLLSSSRTMFNMQPCTLKSLESVIPPTAPKEAPMTWVMTNGRSQPPHPY